MCVSEQIFIQAAAVQSSTITCRVSLSEISISQQCQLSVVPVASPAPPPPPPQHYYTVSQCAVKEGLEIDSYAISLGREGALSCHHGLVCFLLVVVFSQTHSTLCSLLPVYRHAMEWYRHAMEWYRHAMEWYFKCTTF